MKIGILRNKVRENATAAEKLFDLGENSGNLVFWDAIEKLFSPIRIGYNETDRLKDFDRVILTDLIWIRENTDFDYLERIVDANTISFIPISIGLQSTMYDINFRISKNTQRLLHKLQERAQLGVRGEYTAEILSKHGVKNIAVIGCPSMYYCGEKGFSLRSELGQASCNFRSFYGKLTVPEKHFLSYCAAHKMQFIEQTKWEFLPASVNDPAYYSYVREWLDEAKILPTDREEWESALRGITFSIGGRFHGNVMALQNGIRAFFLTVDSRTKELTDFFRLPSVPMARFIKERPLAYYFDRADYTDFSRVYPTRFSALEAFAAKNGLVKATPKIGKRQQDICMADGKRKESKIVLRSILHEKNKLVYDYEVSGPVSVYFAERRPFTVEYGCNMENVPDAVAAIPFLSLVLPVCWLTDAELSVKEVDEDFAECIDEVKRGYASMYPSLAFRGRMKIGRTIKNTVDHSLRRTLCFFSGGVDAVSTLLSNLCYRPELFTVWGADVYFEQEEAWRLTEKKVAHTAEILQLAKTSVKTSFRYVLDEKKLTEEFAAKVGENWWHGFEHGLALLGHAAPYAYRKDITDIKIAASYDASDRDRQTCASDPVIDERVCYCGCKIYHDGFEKTRTDKVRQILRFAQKTGIYLQLRVCWEQITGENCCTCEKCGRTIFAIYAAGGDPQKFGFDLTEERKKKILKNIRAKSVYKNRFWEEILRLLYERREELKDNVFLSEILKDYTPPQSNFKKTIFCNRSLRDR